MIMKDSNYIFFGWWMWDDRTESGYEDGFPQFTSENDCPVTAEMNEQTIRDGYEKEMWKAIKIYKLKEDK